LVAYIVVLNAVISSFISGISNYYRHHHKSKKVKYYAIQNCKKKGQNFKNLPDVGNTEAALKY